jgi:hypothetical protein
MHNAANDAAIINSLDTSHILRQMRLNPSPLLIAQPEEVFAHAPDPSKSESGAYRIRIVLSPQ